MGGVSGVTIYGVDAGDSSGQSVSYAGDINGDGFDDLIIGAPLADGPSNARSKAGDTMSSSAAMSSRLPSRTRELRMQTP